LETTETKSVKEDGPKKRKKNNKKEDEQKNTEEIKKEVTVEGKEKQE
jgi:hypothetical protein